MVPIHVYTNLPQNRYSNCDQLCVHMCMCTLCMSLHESDCGKYTSFVMCMCPDSQQEILAVFKDIRVR